MSRYIDADKLWETIKEHDYTLHDRWNTTDRGMFSIGIQQAIDEQVDEDVKPVIHGYYNNKGCCNVCGSYIPTDHRLDYIDKSDVRYCYYCGAKMDGELK